MWRLTGEIPSSFLFDPPPTFIFPDYTIPLASYFFLLKKKKKVPIIQYPAPLESAHRVPVHLIKGHDMTWRARILSFFNLFLGYPFIPTIFISSYYYYYYYFSRSPWFHIPRGITPPLLALITCTLDNSSSTEHDYSAVPRRHPRWCKVQESDWSTSKSPRGLLFPTPSAGPLDKLWSTHLLQACTKASTKPGNCPMPGMDSSECSMQAGSRTTGPSTWKLLLATPQPSAARAQVEA